MCVCAYIHVWGTVCMYLCVHAYRTIGQPQMSFLTSNPFFFIQALPLVPETWQPASWPVSVRDPHLTTSSALGYKYLPLT